MRSLLWLIALIMIFGWGLGFFVWSAPAIIHLLLVIAVVAIVINLASGRGARV